jgi:hypothetical protein
MPRFRERAGLKSSFRTDDSISQCVGPVIESEADFDCLPWHLKDSTASSFGTDRATWPDWLQEKYKNRPVQGFYDSSKYFEDWPQFKARMESVTSW